TAWAAQAKEQIDSSTRPAKPLRLPGGASGLPAKASGLARQLAHDVLLAPGDRKLLLHAVQQHHPVAVGAVLHALEAADRVARDQTVAMDADVALGELLLEAGERFLQQVLARRRAGRD